MSKQEQETQNRYYSVYVSCFVLLTLLTTSSIFLHFAY